ncbi:MAG: hypothetical protein GX998_07845 [Firmicutes bacterium]|nr:hypothetical protein [Bacillota bacterium]
MVARHRWLLLGVAVFSFCLGFCFTVWVWQGAPTSPAPVKVQDQLEAERDLDIEQTGLQESPFSGNNFGEPQLRLLSEADLVRTVISDTGQVLTTSTSALPEELVGRTLGEIRSIHPEWRVVGFSPERLTVRIPETHMETLYGHLTFLGISDGKVAVFRGKPEVYRKLVRVTSIPISSLPEFEIRNFERGIPYNGEEELSLLLESLKEREE